jgi:hypothetical protein
MDELGNIYLVIGAGLGVIICFGMVFLMWCLADISADCDDCEGVRDAE